MSLTESVKQLEESVQYALKVFESHCESNRHSLGCDYALSRLRNALKQELSEQDKDNLIHFGVSPHDSN